MSHELIGQVQRLLVDIEDAAEAMKALDDHAELAGLLDAVSGLRKEAQVLERSVEQKLVEVLPEWSTTVEGVGVITKRAVFSGERWESEALLKRIVSRALFDPETGAVRYDSPTEAVDGVLSELLACLPVTASTRWRVGALTERGIGAADFRSRVKTGTKIEITKAS